MNFDDIKERILSLLRRIAERIQDTPFYGQMKDRFDGLSPSMQRLSVLMVVLAGFLIILIFPWTWYGESQDIVNAFEERRNVIRELLKVSREATDVPDIPMAPPIETIRTDLQARMKDLNLLDEQIKSIDSSGSSSKLIPADKTEGGLAVSLAKLNLRQVVDVGSLLTRLSPSLKVTDLEMKANREDARYFDVIYRLTALAVPDLSAPPPEPEPPSKGGKKPSAKPKKGDDE